MLRIRAVAIAAAAMAFFVSIPAMPAVSATTLVVNSTGDAGDTNPGDGVCNDGTVVPEPNFNTKLNCTLRAAIEEANAAPGADTIAFDIPGEGVHTISPSSPLPAITERVTIDGTTQPGYAGSPIVELSGAKASTNTDGLKIETEGTTVRGLVINRFGRYGVVLDFGGQHVIQGNYIGTDVSGTSDLGNGLAGIIVGGSHDNEIGGVSPSSRNVISGNDETGVRIGGPHAVGNAVRGNYIGVDVTGAADLGNAYHGVHLHLGASDNEIGGASAGEGNVISGNGLSGVFLQDSSGGNSVRGNYIGTDASGSLDIGNAQHGLWMVAPHNTVGGLGDAGNVISGNDQSGVEISGAGATGNVVRGNLIGTDVEGKLDLGNTMHGVHLVGAPANVVGGVAVSSRNVISGNNGAGIRLDGGAIQTGNQIGGNLIGTTLDGVGALGNSGHGIDISSSTKNLIGLAPVGGANLISFNGGDGVNVAAGTENWIVYNQIQSNAGLGIDLGADGVNPIDIADSDTGPNNLQNFPTLTSAASGGVDVLIQGDFNSKDSTAFDLAFYVSPTCDPTGYGEGSKLIGVTTVVTRPPGGDLGDPFSVILPKAVGTGEFITAVASDFSRNTSEFSVCVQVAWDADADDDG